MDINIKKHDPLPYSPSTEDRNIIDWITKEVRNVESATEDWRDTIKRLRKNYKCFYDEKTSRITGREKIFVPLTKQMVNAIAPRTRVNARAIVVNATEEGDIKKAMIAQEVLRWQTKKLRVFEKFTNEEARNLCTDGTIVAKLTWDDECCGYAPVLTFPDLLDIYMNPTYDSIEEAPYVIERFVKTLSELQGSDLYTNIEFVQTEDAQTQGTYDSTSTQNADIGSNSIRSEVEFVELFECWTDEWVYTVAGRKAPVLVRKEENSYGYKPYVDGWYNKVGRTWYGESPAYDLIDLQRWRNQVTNQRIDSRLLISNPMFLVQKGVIDDISQLISRPAGFIETSDINGIKPLPVDDVSATTFTDEQSIDSIAQAVTGNFELANMASTGTASGASIMNQAIENRFTMLQDSVKDFFTRLLTMMLDQTASNASEELVIRITGMSEDELKPWDELSGDYSGKRDKDNSRYLTVFKPKKTLMGEFDIEVDFDQSAVSDRNTRSRRLTEFLGIVAQDPEARAKMDVTKIYREFLRMQGFNPDNYMKSEEEQGIEDIDAMMNKMGQPSQPVQGIAGKPMTPGVPETANPMESAQAGADFAQ